MSNRLTLDPLLVTEPARRFRPPLHPQLPLQQERISPDSRFENLARLPYVASDSCRIPPPQPALVLRAPCLPAVPIITLFTCPLPRCRRMSRRLTPTASPPSNRQ